MKWFRRGAHRQNGFRPTAAELAERIGNDPWSPFNEFGYIAWPRLTREGWHPVGAVTS